MTTTPASGHHYRDARIARPTVLHETRADGTILLCTAEPAMPVEAMGFSSFAARWAASQGERPAFSERDGVASWRTLTWSGFHRQMLTVAAGLLELGLSSSRPLMILSGNSIEQAVLIMAAEYVGIPTAPVSPSYSLLSQEFTRLLGICELVEPAAVFVQSASQYGRALQVMGPSANAVIAVNDAAPGQHTWQGILAAPLTPQRLERVEQAHAAIDKHHTARIFFTSGSTGVPKGVPITYDNVAMMIAQLQFAHQHGFEEPMVILDWLPWNHLFAGVCTIGRALVNGASYYIDDGRPLPGQFARSVQNVRDVRPTHYTNVPGAWAMLAIELEKDKELAQALFSRLRLAYYGGASLSRDAWERFQAAAVAAVGERIVFASGFGSTETTGMGSTYNQPGDDVGNVGVPNPGMEVKLVPLEGGDGRYEVRMRGRHIFPGYLKRPDLTAAAIDAEGFYSLGDAVRLADPADPAKGMRYVGRCVEDFKLSNGTWVRTGSIRVALIERVSPLITDAVICGHDRDEVAALAWPNVEACRKLAPELVGLSAQDLVRHPIVVTALAQRLQGQNGPTSQLVQRVMLMAEPPSSDAHEIADKGYINQAATRQRRAGLIDALYAPSPAAHVASAD